MHPVYDPFDPAFQDDPYPAYAWLREHDPVHHRPKTQQAPAYWALTRFDDVWDAVRRPEDFSSAQGLTFYPDEIGQLGPRADHRDARPAGADPAARADRQGVHASPRGSAGGQDPHVRAVAAGRLRSRHRPAPRLLDPDPDLRAGRAARGARGRARAVRSLGLGAHRARRRRVRADSGGRRSGGGRDVRVLRRRDRPASRAPAGRPGRRARGGRGRQPRRDDPAAQRLGHPRLLLRDGRRGQRHHRCADLPRDRTPRPVPRPAHAAARRPRPGPGRGRGVPADGVLRAGAWRARPRATSRSAASPSRPARRCSCSTARPTAT